MAEMLITSNNKSMIYIFTGEGKGKTSAALGVAVRAVCAGLKVGWVAWYKEMSWPISEKELPKFIPIDFYLLGKGFHINNQHTKKSFKTAPLTGGGIVVDRATENEHHQAAKAAINQALQMLESETYDVLILDELNNALADGLITWSDTENLILHRGKTHLVITGRNSDPKLNVYADLITEMKKIKHPYDSGIKAVKGLDF